MGRYTTIECDRCGKTRGPREHEWRAWVEITVHGPLADTGDVDDAADPIVLCAACWQALMNQDEGGYIQPLTGYRIYLWTE